MEHWDLKSLTFPERKFLLGVMGTDSKRALLVLHKKYEEGKRKNPRWSKRAFARRLGLSPGAISEILSGKRTLSLRLKKKIAPLLDLSPKEEVDFFSVELPSEGNPSKLSYHTLNEDQFRMISDWWHYAILNLVKTKGFQPSTLWIARRLGISPKVALQAWERLFRLGHLQWKGTKVIRRQPRIKTTDDVLSASIQKAHAEDAKLMARALTEVPLHLRDQTSMTFVMNKRNMAKAKEMIRLFEDKFAHEIHTEPGEEVYKLSVALFPLSHAEENP